MDIKQYTRKPFPVDVAQLTLQNVHEVAEWCSGTVEQEPTRVLGTEMMMPVIKIDGKGENRGKLFTASLGCYIVQLKGNFRVYKPATFEATFDEVPEGIQDEAADTNFSEHDASDHGVYVPDLHA